MMQTATQTEQATPPTDQAPSPTDISISKQNNQIGYHKSSFRWVVLLMLFINVFSMIYCYDDPSSLQNQLQDEYSLSSVEYNFLYSIYGYVNAILPLLSGLFIDWIGINSSSLLFYILIVIGQSLWIFGCISSSYPVMILGRGIFGGGVQPFHTSRKYYLREYFVGMEYSFASGTTISASRIASAMSSYVTTQIYKCCGIVVALSFGWILVIISLFLLIIFIIYRKIKTSSNPNMNWKTYLSTISLKSIYSKSVDKDDLPLISKKDDDFEDTRSKFNLNGLWNGAFDKRFWLLSMVLNCFYSSYLSFTNIRSSFLQARFGYSLQTANDLTPIMFFIAAFTAPIFGLIADKYGKRFQLLILSSLLLISSQCIFGFIPSNSSIIFIIIALILFGFGMSIGSAILWPMMGSETICSKQYLATSLGVGGCLDNAFQGTSFLIVGLLTKDYDNNNTDNHHHTDQYIYATYWILSLTITMLILVLILWYYDYTEYDSALNKREDKFEKKNSIQDFELAQNIL